MLEGGQHENTNVSHGEDVDVVFILQADFWLAVLPRRQKINKWPY